MENDRIKILFITIEYGEKISGGIGRVVNSLAPLLARKIDLQIMLVRNCRTFKFTRIYRIRNNQWVKSYGRFMSKRFAGLINQEKYDVVHLFHGSSIATEAIKVIKEFFPQLKVVYSCHSIAKHEFPLRHNHPDALKDEALIINHCDHLHLLNQASLKYLQTAYPSITRKIAYSIIPNGIDADPFQKKDTRFQRKLDQLLNKTGKITVLCMSRWSWGKGLEYLLEAIPQVIGRYQNIQFVIAGRRLFSWEYRYRAYLRAINRKITLLDDYVIPLDWLDDRQRNTLFSYADIWVMPSLLEYFPYSILEPMLAGIPIISARIDSVCELLTENEECLFYEPTNPAQLAERLLTLIHNPDLRKIIAANALQKVTTEYPWTRIAEMYLQMYQFILKGPTEPIELHYVTG